MARRTHVARGSAHIQDRNLSRGLQCWRKHRQMKRGEVMMRRPLSESLKTRIRGEFLEMPGLCLTLGQASRLWQISAADCRAMLEDLIAEGFLSRTPNGSYVALPASGMTRSPHRSLRSR